VEDHLLWEKMLKGDKKSLEAIYIDHVDALYDYGRKFSMDHSLVEDCIQNLFIYIWEKRDTLSQTTYIRSYLMLSLRRRIIREIKNDKTKDLSNSVVHFFEEPGLGMEDEIIRDEIEEKRHFQLKGAIEKLSPKQREIIYLKFNQNMSNQDIADLLGINNQSVRNSVSRAINSIKKYIFLLLF